MQTLHGMLANRPLAKDAALGSRAASWERTALVLDILLLYSC
jgi:hypothetical protein